MLKIIKLILKKFMIKKKLFSCFLIVPFSQTIAPSRFGNLKYSTVLTLYLIFTLVLGTTNIGKELGIQVDNPIFKTHVILATL